MTGEGSFVEVQGTAEHGTFDRDGMDELLALAEKGIVRYRRAGEGARERRRGRRAARPRPRLR